MVRTWRAHARDFKLCLHVRTFLVAGEMIDVARCDNGRRKRNPILARQSPANSETTPAIGWRSLHDSIDRRPFARVSASRESIGRHQPTAGFSDSPTVTRLAPRASRGRTLQT